MTKTIVRCSKCNAKFDSPMAFNSSRSFETSALLGNQTKCPSCGENTPLDKQHIIFVEVKSGDEPKQK